MNKEQMLKRLAMNIVNQLFDLADVPVEKRQAINDEADAGVLRLLQQCDAIGSYAIVRWIENQQDDVVCFSREVAEAYVERYNELSGEQKCYVDDDIWKPLLKA